jgi:hypothetical protein
MHDASCLTAVTTSRGVCSAWPKAGCTSCIQGCLPRTVPSKLEPGLPGCSLEATPACNCAYISCCSCDTQQSPLSARLSLMALPILFIVKNKSARAVALALAKVVKAIPGIVDKTFFHAVPHDRHCHDHYWQETDCGDIYETVFSTSHKTEKARMVTRVTCFKEPLMVISQELRERPPMPTGGALPDHNFLVAEIRQSGNDNNAPRYSLGCRRYFILCLAPRTAHAPHSHRFA